MNILKGLLSLSLSRFYVSPLTQRELTRAQTRAPLAITREGAQGVADTRHLSHSIKAWGESLATLSLFLPFPIPSGFENVIRLKLVIKNRWRE